MTQAEPPSPPIGAPVGAGDGVDGGDPTGPEPVASGAGLSIHEFLTDGSLSRLCTELGELTGLEVELRDERERLIVPVTPAPADGHAWRVLDEAESGPIPPDADLLPMRIEDQTIATLVLRAGPPEGAPREAEQIRARVRSVLELLGLTGTELCRDVLELRHRVKELGVLYRLSAMLAARTPMDSMLDAALEAAISALGLDAGSIVLLPEDADGVAVSNDEADLVVKASMNLSKDWVESPIPLSRGRLFDRILLNGEVLIVEDLQSDARVLQPERAEREGLRSFIGAPMIMHGRPMGLIRLYSRALRRFSAAEQRLLQSIGEQGGAAVHQARLLEAQKHDRAMERQLRLASDVQRRMLPRDLPRIAGLDVAARSDPTYELAGDFYDLFEVGGALGMVVGDVVGKGVAAALLMSAVRASLRAHVQNVYDIDEVVARVNRAMCADTLDNEFATLWYGVVEPNTLRLTYASAGHDPPFVIRTEPGRAPTHDDVHPLAIGGLVLGIDASQSYPKFVHELRPGDVLVALTDGMTDARDFSGQKFGWTRLVQSVLDTLAETPDATASHVLEQVFWTVRRFVGLRRQVDDETLVILRVDR